MEEYQSPIKLGNIDREHVRDKTIQALFEEQVKRTPYNIALAYKKSKLTYNELNDRVNQLAHFLKEKHDIQPDTLIGLCLDQNEYVLIGILAVLKAGGAYVPVDSSYPDERIQYIFENTNTKLVLTNETYKLRLQNLIEKKELEDVTIEKRDDKQTIDQKKKIIEVVAIDCQKEQKVIKQYPKSNPKTRTCSKDLAYVIYTSGSTGQPKGVMIEHHSFISIIKNIKNLYFPEKENINTCSFTNYVFDIFGLEYGLPLFTGGTINLESKNDTNLIDCSNYNFIQMTPSLCDISLVRLLNTSQMILLIGGENLSRNLLTRILNKSITIVNVYGPTETTIWSTSQLYTKKDLKDLCVSIGKPFFNEKTYVLNDSYHLQSIGTIGELYIGGEGLGRGYLNRPDLTEERFIPNPFQTDEEKNDKNFGRKGRNARLYRTGDLVKKLADETLEFIGRNDFQVKIRGHRIELGEIENTISNYEGIKQNVVIAKERNEMDSPENKYLVAYYVADKELDENAILKYIQRKLPEHMIPSVFMHLTKFPLTLNGKLDLKALPDPEFTRKNIYIEPRNDLEARVCKIWADTLGLSEGKIGMTDSFFQLGGNSILAIKLINKINGELAKSISVSAIFRSNTVEKLVLHIQYNEDEKVKINKSSVKKYEEQSLSFAQERLWFIEKYTQGTKAYNEPMIFELGNKIQLDILEHAIKGIINRHEALRTFIKEDKEGNGYQFVLNDLNYPFQITKNKCNFSQLEDALEKQVNYNFNINNEYPIRVQFHEVRTVNKSTLNYMSVVIHHIVFDGWSMDVFLKDLKEFYKHYQTLSQGLASQLNLPELTIQYKDFSLWQREYLSGEVLDKQLCYWKNKLADYETLNLITDKQRPNQFDYRGNNIKFHIDEETSLSLRQLAKELEVSLYTVLLSGFFLMLKCYSNQNDLVVGTPIANRHYSQIENLIGFFVNTIVLRTEIDTSNLIVEFIQSIGREVIEAQLHQDLPFEKIVEELKVKKDPSRNPIFQVMFGVDSFGKKQNINENSIMPNEDNLFKLCMVGAFCKSARFDLDIFVDDSSLSLNGIVNYAASLFEENTIKGFIKTYIYILKQFSKMLGNQQNRARLADISYLSNDYFENTIKKWNATEKEYPNNKTIQTIFEEQVNKTPDNVAVSYNAVTLTYNALNERANQLANFIIHAYDIQPDSLVLLCLDRSENMLIAILAILKAGGAYVPIDVAYPDDRIEYILEDTRTKLIITNRAQQKRLERVLLKNAFNEIDLLAIDDNFIARQLVTKSKNNPTSNTTSNNLAYVIYTSGTTGRPKGVMIEQKGVVNYIQNIKTHSLISSEDKVDFSTSIGFDLSVTTSLGSLCLGSQVVIYENSLHDINLYKEHLINNEVTIVKLVPSYFDLIIDILNICQINKIILGGEKLTSNTVNQIFDQNINRKNRTILKVYDEYGPTENTVGTCISKIDSDHSLTIGKFYDNHIGFVLDEHYRLLPIGAIGELYVGGEGLARGYLNRNDLTKERFIINPFQDEEQKKTRKNARLYKTGDLVRWLSDGSLEYIGRNDFQVKIRGNRIELGEIESVLSEYKNIKQCVVIARDREAIDTTGSIYLVAYYVRNLIIEQEDDHQFVKTWEDLYQDQYSSLDINNFKQNLSGWTSSYTGKEISKEDMIEWVVSTTDRIKELNPKIILEIGCGSGLILFNMIEHVEQYLATDLSMNAIEHASRVVEKFGYKEKVFLYCSPADSVLNNLSEKSYDTVVINSVIQYFPNLEYLDFVISKSIENIHSDGKIFIGDVRDYRLFECFHYSVQKYKNGKTSKTQVEYFSKRDKELLISPEYFISLKEKNNLITYVEVMPKKGKSNHEMNNYRYDVILHIKNIDDKEVFYINQNDFIETNDIEKYMVENEGKDYLCIKYRNKRIENDYIEWKQLSNNFSLNEKNVNDTLEIDEIIDKAKHKGYSVKFFVNLDSPLYFNVILYKDYIRQQNNFRINYNLQNETSNGALSNNPLLAAKIMENNLGKEIKTFLTQKIPTYMIPDYYVQLEELPLTINGKLDRKSLPNPEFIDVENYVAPTNEMEVNVCRIWAEVLGLSETVVGIHDDFFRLGGNSILAIRLISRMNRELSRNLRVAAIFKEGTIFKLLSSIENENEESIIQKIKVNIPKEQKLSFAQERLWFIEKYEDGTNAYNMPMIFKISNTLNLEVFEASLKNVVAKHEILRTLIKEDEGSAYQCIIDVESNPLTLFKKTIKDQAQLDENLQNDINYIFDFSQEIPIRVCLYEFMINNACQAEKYLSIVIHHIAFDGWSMPIFLKEIQESYNYYLLSDRSEMKLPEASIQYKDFSLWQRNYLVGERLKSQLNYWKEKLYGYETLNLLPDFSRPQEIDYKGADVFFEVDEDISVKLRDLAKELKVSLYSILLSAYYLMLKSYSNQSDIVIGTPIANRHYGQIENLIGLFVNTLALRTKIDEQEKIIDYIERIGREVKEAQIYQDLPFEKIIEELNIDKDTSRHPVFQVMFGLENYKTQQDLKNSFDEFLIPYLGNAKPKVAQFDLSTFIEDQNVKIVGTFNYATSLYQQEKIHGLIDTYKNILEQLANLTKNLKLQERMILSDLNYLTGVAHKHIVSKWNETDKEYSRDKTIHALFEEQTTKTPNNIAVTYEETRITYDELNIRANQLAYYITKNYGVKSDTLIALYLDRSEYILISILAILKAGGAYVPLDPDSPPERISYILEDTKTQLILTNKIYKEKLESITTSTKQGNSLQIFAVNDLDLQENIKKFPINNFKTGIKPTDLAYVIYTSGSTGQPKGVMIEHVSFVMTIMSVKDLYFFEKENINTCSFTSYMFDIFGLEYGLPLFTGGTVRLESNNNMNLVDCSNYDFIQMTPSLCDLRLDFLINTSHIKLLIGGENLSRKLLTRILNKAITIINVYGPTETTIWSTSRLYSNEDLNDLTISIGKPFANEKTYVLDDSCNLKPIGGIGELYIGGEGLARGYLNREDLTDERFIKNPFQMEEEKKDKDYGKNGRNGRIYKTGDLVRWLNDGNLEYLGRNDFQVKVRGYRIELGEIETALLAYAEITQSVVLVRERLNQDKYLIGYYVSKQKIDDNLILNFLKIKLPEYMVPSALVHLEVLPLTVNGKIDRKVLPDAQFGDKNNYVSPRNKLEIQVSQIWAELLGLSTDKVGIQDDFFRLGGDSIVSIQLVSRLRQRLNLRVSVKDVFTYKTIGRIYDEVLSKTFEKIEIKTEQGMLNGLVPLLPQQEWFFKNNFKHQHHWNQSFTIKTQGLEIAELQRGISKLIEYHDAFRLKFKKQGALSDNSSSYFQFYDDKVQIPEIKPLDIKTLGIEGTKEFEQNLHDQLTQWQSKFDLEVGPLYCIGYLYGYQDNSARIFFALHHLIVDSVSWRILMEDLRTLYSGTSLNLKRSSYRQWVETVNEYGRIHIDERDYWLQVLSNYEDENDFSKLELSKVSNSQSISLSKEKTMKLLETSNASYHTEMNDLLLTALGYALSKLKGTMGHHIVMEGQGREKISPDIDITRTLGWFTTIYPVKLEIRDEIGETLKNIKETLRQIPNKGIGYGILMGYGEKLPRISFNYLGQFEGENLSKVQESADKTWRIVEENVGQTANVDNNDYFHINISSLVINGTLLFKITTKLNVNKAKLFSNAFKESLEEIISHTTNQTRTYLTVSDVDLIINQEYLDVIQETKEIDGVYRANSLQQGFIYHALSQGFVDDAYRIQLIWEYGNNITPSYLKESWESAQRRYSSLRLRFSWEEEIVQIIDRVASVNWKYIDLSKETKEAQTLKIKQIQIDDRKDAYDLEKGNLLRIILIKQNDDLYTCIFSSHHAILDGWSIPILLGYVHKTYISISKKEELTEIKELGYELSQKYIQVHDKDHEDYWKNYLSKIEERGDLSGLLMEDKKHVKLKDYKHIKHAHEKILILKGKEYKSLKDLSQEVGITLNAIFLYVWNKTLSIYGNTKQTIVGITVSGRGLPIDNIENSVGLYINTLPLLVEHDERNDNSILDSIKKIQNDINEINTRSAVSLVRLQSEGERLFDCLFVYENYPNPTNDVEEKQLKIKFKEGIEKIDYPLGVVAYEEKEQLVFKISYASELFDAKAIERVLSTIEVLLDQLKSDPYQKERHLNYLNKLEYTKIVEKWNMTEKAYPYDKTIHALFEEQAERTPNKIAVIYENIRLTYKELNDRVNQLAHYIRKQHLIQPDTLIALYLGRSEHMLIGILATLKAGAAYVPMDPNNPDNRTFYILDDTNTKVVLTNEIYKETLQEIVKSKNLRKADAVDILAIDNLQLLEELSKEASVNPKTQTNSLNLAYVIYTSGTTGNPKGVMIPHQGIVNLKYDLTERYNIGDGVEDEVILQFASYAFDPSVEQLVISLLNGHSLLIIPNQLWLDKDNFYDYLNKNKITHFHSVPGVLKQYDFRKIKTLKRILSGGDHFTKGCYEQVKTNSYATIINEYGPTETSITNTVGNNGARDIGSPISNNKCYVLDSYLRPLPIGAIGELYIGGDCLARGYLNRIEITKDKFIPNPFQTLENKNDKKFGEKGRSAYLYKTGDLMRWLPDGNLEFAGRNDFQVKIRGYRIELGEIESAVLSCEGIKQCVVLAKEHVITSGEGSKYLVGYYVSEFPLDEEKMMLYLKGKLPDYMVPSTLVHLKHLPVDINGKLERKLLPEPDFTSAKSYAEARNALEEQIIEIWAEVLGLPKSVVGIRDDFFRLGGDSIVSIQLISRLRQRLNVRVSVKDIFAYRTIELLHDSVLSKISDEHKTKTEQGILKGEASLLPIQKWFFASNFVDPNYWNQSFIVRTSNLEIQTLQRSIAKLIDFHDAFRLRYKRLTATSYTQFYDNKATVPEIKILDIRTLGHEGTKEFDLSLHELISSWQNNFNLEKGPIYCIGYLYGYKDGTTRVIFALHHLIVDSVSWRILTDNLKTLYAGGSLNLKGSSYRQWVEAVKEYGKTHEEEKNYWINVLSDYKEKNKLTNLALSKETNNQDITITKESTRMLLETSNELYHTEVNDILLTTLVYALNELSESSVYHIVLEGHGREEIDPSIDITGTLGWFTTMYPVRLEVREEIGETLKYIKETLRQIPNKGIGYGVLVGYDEKLPQICFNYLGQFDGGDQSKTLENIKGSWKIVGEDSGLSSNKANEDCNLINMNGLVIDGMLHFNIATKFDKKKTQFFANSFKQNLEKIIAYTINQTRTYLTVSDVNKIVSQKYLDKIQEEKEIIGVYKANSLQQGFIYHTLNQGLEDDAYRVQLIWEYENNIISSYLKKAWESAQRKYSSLRLRFAWEEELVQIIDHSASIDWRCIDLSKETKEIQTLKIKQIQQEDRKYAYDLEKGGLFRILLIKQKKDLYTCIFSCHHAILDGWSIPILLRYIHDIYLKICNGEEIKESKEYGYEASQKYIQEHEKDNQEYWSSYISGLEEKADLSGLLKSEKQNVKLNDYKHIRETQDIKLKLENIKYKKLKELSQKEGITLNAILLYVWHKTLSIYGNTKQTIIGITVSGRGLPVNDIENSVGLYINTLPLIVDHQEGINTDKSILDSIKKIQDNVNEINARSNISLARLNRAGERLFDSLFVYENYPDSVSEEQEKQLKIIFKEGIEKVDYPLGIVAYEGSQELIFKINYAAELFDLATMERVLSTVEVLLDQLLTNPHQQEKDLEYLSASEYKQIVEEWNTTDTEYPLNKTIHELFEEQVELTPNNVSIKCDRAKHTYRELNEKANQLASYIKRQYDISPGTLIAFCLDRNEEMFISILAILKVGGAYVPIDPDYPDERIQYIFKDTSANLLLTNKSFKHRFQNYVQVLTVDDQELKKQLVSESKVNLEIKVTRDNLAYVIYTSGTTGNPKGVTITHRNLAASTWARSIYYPCSTLNIAIFSLISFDITTGLIFWGLTQGGSLFSPAKDILQRPTDLRSYLNDNKITHITFVPSVYTMLLEQKAISRQSNVKLIFLGGEACPKDLVIKHFETLPQVDLYNEYGPTENTVWSTVDKLYDSLNQEKKEQITIGTPIPNTKCYVLDNLQRLLPIGSIGELYIGGAAIAQGYLNLPSLTKEKFIPNPFQTEDEKINENYGKLGYNARLYKTGDLVRRLSNGNLEYIGRNDFQVKIRGFRIELKEIESIILKYRGVKQSVVLAKELVAVPGEISSKYLVGYYVSETVLDEENMMSYLKDKLPDHMLPSVFCHLTHLPITDNGKLDWKSLPDPNLTSIKTYMAPRNILEEQIVEIWSELLGLSKDNIGIRDDFFKLGGDSITSIQLVGRLKQRLELKVSVKLIFLYKTIEKLYDNILSKICGRTEFKTEQGILNGEVPLLPIQEWFFESNFEYPNHWNQSFIIRTPNLNVDELKKSISKLIEYHDAFRLKFRKASDSSYSQFYDDRTSISELKILDIRTLGLEGTKEFKQNLHEILSQWQKTFNIEEGPLYCIGYLYGYEDGSSRIFFALHHLITDTVSWRILTENLRSLYTGGSLHSKGSSYRQWGETIKEYGRLHVDQMGYWINTLYDYEENNELTKLEITRGSSCLDIMLTKMYTKKLLGICNETYHTRVNDLLLTALGYALKQLTKNPVHHIVLEGHGREEIDPRIDISGTLGWFTTMYPVRLEIREEIGESLKYIKETLRQVPNKGIGYGPLIGYKEKLPKVTFNYLGQFDEETTPLNNDRWTIVGEGSGVTLNKDNYDPNLININGLVIDGFLKFNIATKFDTRTTKLFAEAFKENLEKIVYHCEQQKISEYTPSDFDDFDPYILFNKTEKTMDEHRIFLLPPGIGGAESYFNNVVPNLKNADLVSFNNYQEFLLSKDIPLAKVISYEKLAWYYIVYIKSIQAKGPYNLFGWSYGGILAFEIARQLVNMGDQIKNIFMIDSYFDYRSALREENISTKEELDNINYKYSPSFVNLGDTNIILFKAKEATDVIKISKHYVETTYNHLDNILTEESNLKVVYINCDHMTWTSNDEVIKKMCTVMMEYTMLVTKHSVDSKVVMEF